MDGIKAFGIAMSWFLGLTIGWVYFIVGLVIVGAYWFLSSVIEEASLLKEFGLVAEDLWVITHVQGIEDKFAHIDAPIYFVNSKTEKDYVEQLKEKLSSYENKHFLQGKLNVHVVIYQYEKNVNEDEAEFIERAYYEFDKGRIKCHTNWHKDDDYDEVLHGQVVHFDK